MTGSPDISILFSTYNRSEYVCQTLEAMTRVCREGLNVEFVVVDNNSNDDTAQVIDSFAERLPLHHLFEPRPGKNCALNHALDTVQLGEIVVFTDDDVVPHSDWLKVISAACEHWPEYDIFGGKIDLIWPNGVEIPRWATENVTIRGIGFAEHDLGTEVKPYRDGSKPSGPNFWVRGKVFREGVRYDESIGPRPGQQFGMGSESELLYRLAAKGRNMLYVPDATVGHHVQVSLLEPKNMLRRAIRSGRGAPHSRCIPDPEELVKSPWRWRMRRIFAIAWYIVKFLRARLRRDECLRMKNAVQALRDYAYHREALAMSWGRGPCPERVAGDDDNACPNENEVRLLVLCAGDPDSTRTFSGSARGLITALKANGSVWHVANFCGLMHPWSIKPYIIRRGMEIIDGRLGLIQRYNSSALCYTQNTKRARRIAAAHPGFNACLIYGTSCMPLGLSVPTYCYFDATETQNSASGYWGTANQSPRKVERMIECERAVFAECRGIFPRSRWAAAFVLTDYGVSPAKVVVAGAGPNHELSPFPHQPYDRKMILFVGREFERKGGPLILDAFRRTRSKLPDARLVIVGCKPDIHGEGVEVLGLINKEQPGGLEQLLKLYSEASLFCIMSTYEPFGIVVLEAQLAGVPCVLPEAFAFPEMVKNGKTGLLVSQYDADVLADAFCTLLSNPAELAIMGQMAHTHVEQRYTWARAASCICAKIGHDLDNDA